MEEIIKKKIITQNDIEKDLENFGFQFVNGSFNKKERNRFKFVCINNHLNEVNYEDWKNRINKCITCDKQNYTATRQNIETLKDLFEKENCKLLTTEYSGCNQKLKYICPNNHITEMVYRKWKKHKLKCQICNKLARNNKTKLSYNYVKQQFNLRGYELISTDYQNKKQKLKFKCNNGHFGEIDFDHFYYAENDCSMCSKSKKKTLEEIRDFFLKENYIVLSKEYINNATKLKYLCPNKHINFMCYKDFYSGNRCPTCFESKGEAAIKKYLEKLQLQYLREKKFHDCKIKKCLPFDFYVDNKFLIEYDGEQHFKNVDFFGGEKGFQKRQLNDKIKTDYCILNGIPLLRISYLELDQIPNIIDKYLRALKICNKVVILSNPPLYNYLY